MPIDTPNENQATLKFEQGISRRDLLLGAGAVASAVVAGSAFAAPETGMPVGAKKMQHHYSHAAAYKKHVALTAAANDCTAKGEICISHCLETFLTGDTTMAECAFAVQQMLPVCAAMAQLSNSDSKHLAAMAKTCIGVCEDCEKECRAHEEHQPECRDCADACAALIKEAKKALA